MNKITKWVHCQPKGGTRIQMQYRKRVGICNMLIKEVLQRVFKPNHTMTFQCTSIVKGFCLIIITLPYFMNVSNIPKWLFSIGTTFVFEKDLGFLCEI